MGFGAVFNTLKSAGTTVAKKVGLTGAGVAVGGVAGYVGATKYLNSKTQDLEEKSKNVNTDRAALPSDPYDTSSADDKIDRSTLKFLKYPLDLGEEYYPHYVTFYINVNSRSKIVSADEDAKKYAYAAGEDYKSTTVEKKDKRSTPGANVASAAEGIRRIGESGINTVGSAVGLDKIKVDSFAASFKRLTTAISLPLPTEITSRYGAEYGQLSTGGLLGSMLQDAASGKDMMQVGKNAMHNLMQSAPGVLAKAGATVLGKGIGGDQGAQIAAGMVDSSTINALWNKSQGQAVNDRFEQAFKRMDFREFSFNYVFAPRSQIESNHIKRIIKMLKYHMHPETGSNSMFLIMPDEFDIEFRFKSAENTYLHKIGTCALSGIQVNNTPIGQYASFEDGSPVIMSLQLQFKELTPLVREMITRGY